jgi:PAS domain S-box-containing protein
MKILIVEDDLIIATDLEKRLKKIGYQVCGIAVSGKGATTLAAEEKPDLILMDIKIKGDSDGITTAYNIKKTLDVAIIYLTSYYDDSTLERAKITEPYGYILKPVDDVELITTIEMALYKHDVEKKIKDSEKWLSTTLKSIGEGVIATDNDGKVKFMNPVAEEWTGWKQVEILNKPLSDYFNIIDESSGDVLENPILAALDTKNHVKVSNNTILISRNGRERFILDSASPILDDSGTLMGAVLVFQDISERKKYEKELILAKEEAENSDKLKSEFLAQVSHEIRTPLNNILGFATLLKDEFEEKLPKGLESAFDVIHASSNRLIHTIELILNMSKLQTGNFEVKFSEIDLNEDILENLMLEFYVRAKDKNLEFIYQNDSVQSWIFSDKFTCEQIFINIIDNAIKFTDSGSININLSGCKNKLVVTVKDSGIGIAPNYLPEIFNAFTQENSGLSRRYEGTGLGLALVKKYVELNNAEIFVESKKGEGTEFRIIFNSINH